MTGVISRPMACRLKQVVEVTTAPAAEILAWGLIITEGTTWPPGGNGLPGCAGFFTGEEALAGGRRSVDAVANAVGGGKIARSFGHVGKCAAVGYAAWTAIVPGYGPMEKVKEARRCAPWP